MFIVYRRNSTHVQIQRVYTRSRQLWSDRWSIPWHWGLIMCWFYWITRKQLPKGLLPFRCSLNRVEYFSELSCHFAACSICSHVTPLAHIFLSLFVDVWRAIFVFLALDSVHGVRSSLLELQDGGNATILSCLENSNCVHNIYIYISIYLYLYNAYYIYIIIYNHIYIYNPKSHRNLYPHGPNLNALACIGG